MDGIYKDGKTTPENFSVEGGYMLLPSVLELVGGWQSQDADGYAKRWSKTSIGANWFLKKHDIKYQVTYDFGKNTDGEKDNYVEELFGQSQYVF